MDKEILIELGVVSEETKGIGLGIEGLVGFNRKDIEVDMSSNRQISDEPVAQPLLAAQGSREKVMIRAGKRSSLYPFAKGL